MEYIDNNCKKLACVHLEKSKIRVCEIISREEMSNVCRVEVETRLNENSFIQTHIWMPENWNGILLGLGNGGMAGSIAGEFWEYSKRGYATTYTDMGTSLVVSGIVKTATEELWKDYGWRATHLSTVFAKTLLEKWYGKKPTYSYFYGCSAGGLQALSEVQRFPLDYDGVISGVPSNNALNLIVYFLWLHVNLRDKSGKSCISRDLAKKISFYASDFFNSKGDGEKGDDFVSYPYLNENTIQDFLAYVKEKEPSLTSKQLSALKAIYEGPKNKKTGEQIFCGMPFGAERNSGYFSDQTSGKFGFSWFRLFFGEEYDDWTFDFADDYERIVKSIGKDFCSVNQNLEEFKNNGGKLIMFSGAADPSGPWAEHVNYYNSVCEQMGGFEKVNNFFKYFLLPGKAHGNEGLGVNKISGENGLDIIEVIRDWREKEIAPNFIVGSHVDNVENVEKVKFTRKIYPYLADKKEGIDYPKCTAQNYIKKMNKE